MVLERFIVFEMDFIPVKFDSPLSRSAGSRAAQKVEVNGSTRRQQCAEIEPGIVTGLAKFLLF